MADIWLLEIHKKERGKKSYTMFQIKHYMYTWNHTQCFKSSICTLVIIHNVWNQAYVRLKSYTMFEIKHMYACIHNVSNQAHVCLYTQCFKWNMHLYDMDFLENQLHLIHEATKQVSHKYWTPRKITHSRESKATTMASRISPSYPPSPHLPPLPLTVHTSNPLSPPTNHQDIVLLSAFPPPPSTPPYQTHI
jgi:hypothetical protein